VAWVTRTSTQLRPAAEAGRGGVRSRERL